jgi:uncharacterized repeat protein (TIGR03847 family)
LLQDLPAPGDGPLPTALELVDPIDAVWVAGQPRVVWDADADHFVVEVEELDPDAITDDEDDDRGRLRLMLTRGQALAFAARAVELVAAGRPSCRFCGLPMDPDGHPCPRMN